MTAHSSPQKARQSVPLFQLVTRGDRLVVMMYVRFPLSLRNVEDLLFERGIDILVQPLSRTWTTLRRPARRSSWTKTSMLSRT